MDTKKFVDDTAKTCGWYQPITFPNGVKSTSPKPEFFDRDDLGEKKWKAHVEPHLLGKESFMEIGCNAGLFLLLAEKYGYEKAYGLECGEAFFKQCQFVLKKFGSSATVYNADAMKFDLSRIGRVDTTLMANALYWMGYDDSKKFIPDYAVRVEHFLKELSIFTKRLILIGGEKVERIGGSLSRTVPILNKYYDVKESRVIETKYRQLNLIVADSKVNFETSDIDSLLQNLVTERGEYSKEFVDSFSKFLKGYMEHVEWMFKYSGRLRGAFITEDRVHDFCVNYLNLFKSVRDGGLRRPIEIFRENEKLQIDGWHRLLIMKMLGHKVIASFRR